MDIPKIDKHLSETSTQREKKMFLRSSFSQKASNGFYLSCKWIICQCYTLQNAERSKSTTKTKKMAYAKK